MVSSSHSSHLSQALISRAPEVSLYLQTVVYIPSLSLSNHSANLEDSALFYDDINIITKTHKQGTLYPTYAAGSPLTPNLKDNIPLACTYNQHNPLKNAPCLSTKSNTSAL